MERNQTTSKRVVLILHWIPVIFWMGVIFFLSTLPESMTRGRYILSDKVCHAGEYFILSFFLLVALLRTTNLEVTSCLWIVFAWVAVYGLSDEIHQLYVPTRQCEIRDLISDVSGA